MELEKAIVTANHQPGGSDAADDGSTPLSNQIQTASALARHVPALEVRLELSLEGKRYMRIAVAQLAAPAVVGMVDESIGIAAAVAVAVAVAHTAAAAAADPDFEPEPEPDPGPDPVDTTAADLAGVAVLIAASGKCTDQSTAVGTTLSWMCLLPLSLPYFFGGDSD